MSFVHCWRRCVPATYEFDAFICHASEDKKKAARPIADGLEQAGLRVFYDEYSLKVGDPLLKTINHGLSRSRFGVVIFSRAFFAKKWPQDELAGLYALETAEAPRILPVWYRIKKTEIAQNAPIFVDRKAANLADGLDRTVESLLRKIAPERIHKTVRGLTLSLTPSEIPLSRQGYSCSNKITLYNPSDNPVYSVWVKCSMLSPDIKSEDVEISGLEAGQGVNFAGQVGPVTIYGDSIRYNCTDSTGREAAFIMFHTVNPKSSLQFVVQGPILETDTFASLKISKFELSPHPILQKDNAAALLFQPPEIVTLKGVSLRMKRS